MKRCNSDVATLPSVSTRAIVLVRTSVTATTLIPSLSERNIRQESQPFYPNVCEREQIREMQISPSIDLPRTSARKLNALYLVIRKQAPKRGGGEGLENSSRVSENGLVDN